MALYLGSNKWNVYLSGNAYHPNCYIRRLINDADIPDYVKIEALELYDKVQSIKKNDSIVFLAMSDSHYPAEQTDTSYYTSNVQSTIIANQAAKTLASALDIDFFTHLGDVSCGHNTTTPDVLESQIEGFLSYFREAKGNLPVFIAIGNHDPGIYYHNEMADGNVYTLDGDYLYRNFTGRSASSDTVFGSIENGGYCYRDFNDKKLRVFLLNTSEKLVKEQKDQATYGAQRVWLANALIDLNSKSDAADWGFIILCHYPADYGATMPLSELLKAYVDGTSFTITDTATSYAAGDGTNQTVSFIGKNNAKFISQFHGHVHNFKTSKLYSYATGSGVQYDAYRICTPNVQFNRENYYSTVGSYTDINFAEDTSYNKTAGTANGTSFVVNVINPSDKIIYSFCYGAGYDRVIGYGGTTYHTIARTLSNVSTNSTAFYVAEGGSYSETITLDTGYEMKSITVKMGGTDISSTAISLVNGKYQINISSVTGNVVITAKASLRPNFTNLVPLSINTDGSDYYIDGDGYDNDVYLSSGAANDFNTSTGYSITTTGFIPVSAGAKTIRIAGDGISVNNEYTRFSFYDSSFTHISTYAYKHLGANQYYPVEIEEASTVLTIQMDGTDDSGKNGVYMRICTQGDGADLIVTVDEEITYGGTGVSNYTITQNLTNVTSSNTSSIATSGSTFSTTLSANSGYELGNVTVAMGGLDVTSSVYSNGVINITNVTGNIVIIATATVIPSGSYTNRIPEALDVDGTSIYNGKGYKTGYRINSSNGEVAADGMCVTGFIPCKCNDVIRIKNVTIAGSKTPYALALVGLYVNVTGKIAKSYTAADMVADANGVITITLPTTSTIQYFRLSCGVIDDTSIITINEEITE